MLRIFATTACAAALWLAAHGVAWAQAGDGPWPPYSPTFTKGVDFPWGPGGYLSLPKVLLTWVVFLAWVRSADWINQDAQRHKLRFRLWNTAVLFSFLPALLLVWVIPLLGISLLLLVLAYGVPLAVYVTQRNKGLVDADKVFTFEHVKWVLSQQLRRVGIKLAIERKEHEPAPVRLTPTAGATERDNSVYLLSARQSPGFHLAHVLLADAFARRASALMLDFTQEAVAVRHYVDGVWLDGEAHSRSDGDAALVSLKLIAGLKADERRARQQSRFEAFDEVRRAPFECKITSQGTKTGERVLVQFDDGAEHKMRLPDIGMRDKMQEQLKQLLTSQKGLFVVAAPPAGGLTALLTATLSSMDRFMRSFVAVEDAASADLHVENVPVTTFNAAAGETPDKVLPGVIRQYPDVIVVPDIINAETAAILCEEAADERLVVISVRAKEAAEALLRVLMLKAPPKRFSSAVLGVLAERLVRKLCEDCREPYKPSAKMLEQLHLPADKVDVFYRPPQNPDPKQPPCAKCQGLGYYGRTGIFELLVVDDTVRQTLLKEPKLESVRAAAVKAGMKTMQDEGLLLVVKGVTSLAELSRVLKE